MEHLDSEKQSELKKLILDYKHLFPDVPSCTDKIFHDVDIGDAKPIKQHPYRLNPGRQKNLHDEIKYIGADFHNKLSWRIIHERGFSKHLCGNRQCVQGRHHLLE